MGNESIAVASAGSLSVVPTRAVSKIKVVTANLPAIRLSDERQLLSLSIQKSSSPPDGDVAPGCFDSVA